MFKKSDTELMHELLADVGRYIGLKDTGDGGENRNADQAYAEPYEECGIASRERIVDDGSHHEGSCCACDTCNCN